LTKKALSSLLRSMHFKFRLFLGTFHWYCPFGLYRFHVVALQLAKFGQYKITRIGDLFELFMFMNDDYRIAGSVIALLRSPARFACKKSLFFHTVLAFEKKPHNERCTEEVQRTERGGRGVFSEIRQETIGR